MGVHFEAGKSQCVSYVSFGGKLAQMVLPEAFVGDVNVVATGGDTVDTVVSGDEKIAPLNGLAPPRVYGLAARPTTLIASTTTGKTAFLDVVVRARRDYGKTVIRLDDVLAVMAFGPPIEPVDMPIFKAEVLETQQDLINRLAATGTHKHLYFSCHRIGQRLALNSSGITDGKVFAPLKGRVETIWLGACAVLSDAWGHTLVQDIAKSADCFVVATLLGLPTTKKYGPNEMEAFTESTCTVFKPDGTALSENAFFRDRATRGFKIVKLGPTKVK